MRRRRGSGRLSRKSRKKGFSRKRGRSRKKRSRTYTISRGGTRL